ncbi:MAG: hypothetical protein ACK4IU_11350 [Tabrizicola flagellatus]|uniref:hypothetical protein n=1 Tax=Tabrizicola flagellatus TaxID=2593021 RepID=UPI00391A779B
MAEFPSRRSVLAGLAALPAIAGGAVGAGPAERPFNLRIVMSGHSLTDPIPHPLEILVRAAGGQQSRGMKIDLSTIPGSPAEHRWDNDLNLPVDARRDIAKYDLLVLTERVAVRATLEWHHADKIALKWFEHAWKNGRGGKGAETVYYASWISLGSGTPSEWDNSEDQKIPFRERLDVEMSAWQSIADFVNANRPKDSPRMRVIPGPKIMAAVYDAIQAGTAPGLSRMQELFEDDIHVNAKGAFLIALAHYAVIYGRDPREIPGLRGEPGWPSAAQQAWMKEVVWTVVSAYPDSGLA